ncbi:hypothetical protein [Pseudomonas anguilliseptica]|uniref:Uncharacterized protein n=1 Tax=Pseudomonas anguilliseptica TaxID=53406 RepID=A0A1H4V1M0_PSEAG|nr:hypothetical protein [Pseudomonas anguilliseptica]SEC74835.1 hypothetical protein SAMN05421553_1377 [Pseudomonas anguilliseptica]
MEILHNVNELPYQIARFKTAWKSIGEQLDHFAEHWPGLCEKNFAQAASIQKVKASIWQMDGKVLDKLFSVQATPLVLGDNESPKIYAELVITTPNTKNGETVELGRMLIDRESELFSTSGEKLLANHDDYASYKLFTSIINAVLRAAAA